MAYELSKVLQMFQANNNSWKQLGFIQWACVTKVQASGDMWTRPCLQPREHLVHVANEVGRGQWLTQSHAVREGRAQMCLSSA